MIASDVEAHLDSVSVKAELLNVQTDASTAVSQPSGASRPVAKTRALAQVNLVCTAPLLHLGQQPYLHRG